MAFLNFNLTEQEKEIAREEFRDMFPSYAIPILILGVLAILMFNSLGRK